MSWCSVCGKRNWRTAQSFALIYFTFNCNFVFLSLSLTQVILFLISGVLISRWDVIAPNSVNASSKLPDCLSCQVVALVDFTVIHHGPKKKFTLNIWVLESLLHGTYVKSFLIWFKQRENYGKKWRNSLTMKCFMNKGKFFFMSFMAIVFFEQNIYAVVRHISMIFITLK